MQRLAIKEKFGYGLGDTASNIVFQVVINFMLYFYTDIFGITAAAAGTLMLVVRLFDAVTDPLMGGALSGWILAYVGYQPNVEQTEAALSGIVFLYAWSSAIASVIVFVCFKFYRLNREWTESNELSTEAT